MNLSGLLHWSEEEIRQAFEQNPELLVPVAEQASVLVKHSAGEATWGIFA